MRKYIRFFALLVVVFIVISATPALAAESDNSEFIFSLTADGRNTKEVNYGDVVTICLKLIKTDQMDSYTMYAMQDELQYDSRILELVPNSEILYSGIATSNIEKADGYRELYLNFLSLSGGTVWNQETVIGTVQFRVVGTSGVTVIKNNDYLVSLQDGSGSYLCKCEDVTLIISTDCTVRFHSNGGTKVEDQLVQYGERISRPSDPQREGYQFEGWYTDIDLSKEWNFESDVVKENMSLYAKWTPEAQSDLKPDEINHHCIYWMLLIIVLLVFLFLRMRRRCMKRK